MDPQYAQLFINLLEEEILQNCTIKPVLYLHNIDDSFIIWTDHPDLHTDFFTIAQQQLSNPLIKLLH